MTLDELFLSRVGHDLRGELATMVAGVHYLLRYEADLGPAARQMLERVNNAGQRLRRLLDEFDNAVWIGGGDPSALLFEPCRLFTLVEAALVRLRPGAVEREAAIEAEVAQDLPELQADPELASVAIEYAVDFALSRSRKKTVHLLGAFTDGVPTLTVIDAGGPLEPAVLATLLEPFAEKDVLPKVGVGQRRRERLGLGLAIARGILGAHGGGMRAELAPGGEGVALHLTFTPPRRHIS